MEHDRRQELYRLFLEFITLDAQGQRRILNRRMLGVLVWCFILPALVSALMLLLLRFHIIPGSVKGLIDWVVLIFPVFYSLYILASEVLAELPAAIRRGGLATSLGQTLKESEWRERVCDEMTRAVAATPTDWDWIRASFRMDLEIMRHRTRYLTGLAGAVLFLLLQGIDSISDTDTVASTVNPIIGTIENVSSGWSQFVGLGLFLILFYLSGMQSYNSLLRYLNCVELLNLKNEKR